ncbi:hypothetical protein DCS_01327 [Drechmeria coniospora]|uniref:Transcription regulator Rua1 C-terminal domain-containing protein n=1 Tax=Drechmeria coniospora TaxID=98403 RepID=A0A151GSZ7_DRECN|nr:hypothetical protein DCS_01327 [Drechmeria coniospora]KYK60191.1 hypothetical protein DCS_01327 [Drechmeria coniospora]ODA80134.1 hypothetical protein RJ55_03092 [Drechmeria coniospora]
MEASQAEIQQQLPPQPLSYRAANDKLPSPTSHKSPPAAVMDSAHSADGMTPSNPAWMTPPTSEPRRRPGIAYQNMACCPGDDCSTVPSWDMLLLQPGSEDAAARPIPAHQQLLPFNNVNGHWNQKQYDESMDFHGLEVDGPVGQAFTTDETVPIIDLRYSNPAQDGNLNRRRMSGSSPTTSGAMSDQPPYDDFSAALSEAPSYSSDYPSTSNRNSLMSSIHLSPVASPRMTSSARPEQVRGPSRGRATPSPRPSVRSVPYSLDGPKNQRWSTGSFAPTPTRRQSPFVYNAPPDAYGMPDRTSFQGPHPAQPLPLNLGAFPPASRGPFMVNGQPMYQRNNMFGPPQPFHSDMRSYDQAPGMHSQGLFKMLQSNGDPHTLQGHYTDLSDPPDLFASLQEEQIPPPEEDMNPSDPEMTPYEQDLRFEGDLYTPRWVRGHGNKREGWCGICKPGRWLVLKNSAFWYDKSFTHGISAATGSPFQEPLDTRRMDGNPDVWEGLCGSCNDWIALVSSKKKGTTWFRHAYKCHTHPKIKDAPKRRRDANHNRPVGAQNGSKVKQELQEPESPQVGSLPPSGFNTPTSVPMPQVYMQNGVHNQLTPGPSPEPLHLAGAMPSTPLSATSVTMSNMI